MDYNNFYFYPLFVAALKDVLRWVEFPMICYYRLREVATYVIPLSCYPHSELPASNLSEILAPSSLMVGRKFELNVDEWKFVGHPFSAQTVSFTTACNVVFVLQVI